eukprot:TRINITY_DN2050_c0_g1_i2.p2 TRINITY_DN2050_c0_g1~~TRINITY_DN2050_c0_g1_i2.p2  ORF type:complete len:181 (+),score=27.99 TRINITY_DN2050_c0_g1_i2:89-631(+)
MSLLQKSLQVGAFELSHRVVLAPLTRMRATADKFLATPLHAEYYGQRASPGGLLITEAIHVTTDSLAYPCTPGLWSREQANSWKETTAAVHAKGGRIFAQLWHTGRVASAAFGGRRVGASNVPMPKTDDDPVIPLTVEELRALPSVYVHSAKLALDAGFDGVEIHGAHGCELCLSRPFFS